MRLRDCAILLVVALLPYVLIAKTDPQQGIHLIEQASAKINIFDLPSFVMKADFQLENFGKPVNGTYSLVWNGSEQWREEIAAPGYREVQVGGKNVVYLKRSWTNLPYEVFQLRKTLGFGPITLDTGFFNIGPQGHEIIKKIDEKRVAGTKADCINILTALNYTRYVCVDETSGIIRRDPENFVDSNLASIGPKLFPLSMSLIDKGKPLVQVHIAQLSLGQPAATSVFQVPAGAVATSGCMNPVPAVKVKVVPPQYPEQDKLNHHAGTVGLYTIIDKSGVPTNIAIALGSSPGLDAASIKALRQWRYAPATCRGIAVPTETIVEIHYTLSG